VKPSSRLMRGVVLDPKWSRLCANFSRIVLEMTAANMLKKTEQGDQV